MIVSISGRIGSGKDTLGMILQALTMGPTKDVNMNFSGWCKKPIEYAGNYEGRPNLKGGWRIMKFAAKLKQMAASILNVPIEQFESQEFKNSMLGPEWNTLTKKWLATTTPYGTKYIDTFELESKFMTVREFLQKLGVAVRENVHGNFWVNGLFSEYKNRIDYTDEEEPEEISRGFPNWIITDTRFKNETEAIKSRGGLLIRIDRLENPFPRSSHVSETELDDYKFDMVVQNTSLEGLVESAQEILKMVK